MRKTTKRLGRGLDSLVSDLRGMPTQVAVSTGSPDTQAGTELILPPETAGDADTDSVRHGIDARMVPLNALHPNPYQPRRNTTTQSVTSLARSIAASGLLQPITVRSTAGRYEIIAGERRYEAARSLGMKQVPVIVRPAGEEQMLELALIENIHREDLNAIDRARAYRDFCTRFNLKPEDLAERLSEDRTTVVNYLRLLDLPDAMQAMVASGAVSMGHARCLAGVPDDVYRQELVEAVVQNDLSVRALEEIIRRERKRGDADKDRAGAMQADRLAAAHIRELEGRFEEVIKTKVTIKEGRRKGTGRLIIEYYALDDFERICALLGVASEEVGE